MSKELPRRLAYVRLDDLKPAPRNAKRHATAQIQGAISEFGFMDTPIVDERTGCLVAGHGRRADLLARRERGETPPDGVTVDGDGAWLVPVLRGWSSRSDAQAEAAGVALNRLTELGGWDETDLAEMLTDIAMVDSGLLAATGYNEGALGDLLKTLHPPDLDALAAELGEPGDTDGWPVLKLKVPHHLAAAWQGHLDQHGGDVPGAFGALLELDPAVVMAPEDADAFG